MKHESFFRTLTEIVTGICAHPDDLRIYTEEDGAVNKLVVVPHMADYGKLVGRGGRQIKAFILLTDLASVRFQQRLAFELHESFIGRSEPPSAFAYDPEFDVEKLKSLIIAAANSVFPSAPEVTITVDGERLFVEISIDRQNDSQTALAAINAVFYPYGFARGRMIHVLMNKPINV